MARFGQENAGIGTLDIRTVAESGAIEAYFVPTEEPEEGSPAFKRLIEGVKLLEFSPSSGLLRIHPTITFPNSKNYLGQKYRQVQTLTLEIQSLDNYYEGLELEADNGIERFQLILEKFPSEFVKDFEYGLGLTRAYRPLIKLIETHTSCNEIHFLHDNNVSINGNVFQLGFARFSEICAELRRISDRGNRAIGRVKDTFLHNNLAETLGLESKEVSLGRHPHSRLIAKAADDTQVMSEGERTDLIEAISSEAASIAENSPQKFQQLKHDIELVSLDQLIETYTESLNQRKEESYWQKFFEDNAFALQQVFGAPMVSVQSSASVGGRRLSGSGDKVADYLYKNSLTNNVALVEIKKPSVKLLQAQEYRGGVFGPSTELLGAISQVLDQAYNLTKNFTSLKDNSRQWDLESYAVSCFVVAGRSPTDEDPTKQKSFELFRGNFRNVKIVTYDEILEQLELLRNFLTPESASSAEAV